MDLKGDGAIVEFQSAVAAVEAAVEVQRAILAAEPGLPEDGCIRFRIGINLGEVIVDGGTIYGDGVKVRRGSRPGASPSGCHVGVYNQAKGKLDLGFTPCGLHQVVNFSEAVETFRVALDGGLPARATTSPHQTWHRAELITAGVLFTVVAAESRTSGRSNSPGEAGDRGVAIRQL